MKKSILYIFAVIVLLIISSFAYESISFNAINKKCVKNKNGAYRDTDEFYNCMENISLIDKIKFGMFN